MTALRVFVPLILMTGVAWADESPCRRDGDNVVCQRDGFDKLVKKLIDEKARADVLDVKLTSVTADLGAVTTALRTCEAAKPPQRSVGPVVTAAIGAAVLTAAVAIDLTVVGRVAGAVVGLAAVGVGITLALP